MPAKPATIQACNTQSCTECRYDGGNHIYAISGCGTDVWWMWDGNDIRFDQTASYPFSRWIGGYRYYSNSGNSCYCDDDNCYNMHWNICRSSS